MRSPVAAVLAGVLLASFGAVILGEYELVGYRPIVAAAVFGAAIAELVATIHREPDAYLLSAVALLAEGALVWATWISTGHHLDLAAGTAWVGVAVGAISAALWLRSAGRRGVRSSDTTGPAPGG
jgi:hypothetical protein